MGVTKNNKVLSDQLIAHFDLQWDPFVEEKGVFFEGAQRQHNLETLRHMSTFGDMVLLLTGEKGAGKSTLIQRFVEVCDDELHIYVSDILGPESKEKTQSVMQRLGRSVGLSVVAGETTRQSFARLIQHLEDQFSRDGSRNVLVFDNADALPKKELQFYFSYFSQLPKESGVVAVFAGAPNLLQVARLSHIEGSDEWLHQIQLKPFAAADMLEYLQLRLENAGYKGLLELTESQVDHLIDIGKGLPGRVNRLFSSVVLEPGSLKLPNKPTAQMPRYVIGGVFGLLSLSFLIVAYQYGLFNIEEAVLEEQTASAAVVESNDTTQNEDVLAQQRAERLKMLDKALSESLSKEQEVASPAKSAEQLALPSSSGVDSSKQNRSGDNLGGEERPERAQLPKPELARDNVSSELVKKADEEASERSAIAGSSKDTVKPPEKRGEAEVVGIEAPAETVAKVQAKSVAKPFFKEREWLASNGTTAYSAQILGSYSEQTAVDFATRVSKEASDIFYLETVRKGKPWYVVFYGVYTDKAKAQAAVNNAPKVIRAQQPWLRRIDGILNSFPKNS